MTESTFQPTPILLTVEEWLRYFSDADRVTADDLALAMGRVGRNSSPTLVCDLYMEDMLEPELAAWAVPDAWSDAEHPMVMIEESVWRLLFEFAGYTENGKSAARPAGPLTLFRGSDAEHRFGWSWTDRVETAQWFADRVIHAERGQVWRATVPPDRLLARITEGREEHEWVVDTQGLEIAEV